MKIWFIGDPCYVFCDGVEEQDAAWDRFCRNSWTASGKEMFHDECTGISVCADGTEFGDGTYSGASGHRYCVDAGIIGVSSIAHLATGSDGLDGLSSLGWLREFEHEPRVEKIGSVIRVFDGNLMVDEVDTVEPG